MKILLFFSLLFIYSGFHSQTIYGCLDPFADNYSSTANTNNFTCIYTSKTISFPPNQSFELPTEINESSGLTLYNSLLWTHNDDGSSIIYGLNPTTGSVDQRIDVGVSVVDWEELQNYDNCFYLGDFGNNASGNRTDLRIFKYNTISTQIDTITFQYSDQHNFQTESANSTSFDCEAFLVTDSMLYLFTKRWSDLKTAMYKIPNVPGNHIAQFVRGYDVEGLITGASFVNDDEIVLVGYSILLSPFVVYFKDFIGDDFLRANIRKDYFNLPVHQVEAIAYDGLHQRFYISNERFQYFGNVVSPKVYFWEDLRVMAVAKVDVLNDWYKINYLDKIITFQNVDSVQILNLDGKSMFNNRVPLEGISFVNWPAGAYLIRSEKANAFSRFILH